MTTTTNTTLFDLRRQQALEQEAPLAARMRPRTLDEFIGQEHIVGPGRLLRRAIQADQLSSVIFWGPPGSGKTTLARIIANTTRAHFSAINAVLAGVKDIREAVAEAQERRGLHGQKTILFVDEVHRFNKAQQDALLPWVENGVVILIGATTENPFFEVNKALVSRSRIFQLRDLDQADLRAIAQQALNDPERGYGRLQVTLDDDALEHLVNVANGDARSLLNALELAVETTPPEASTPPLIHITRGVAEESIQRRAVLYDKDGDAHFDTISAFIKSLRGSDADAALYWLAKMVYAGEDPRFIFRRMAIFAGEDVGMADPHALQVVMAAAQAFDYVGLPEGRFHLALACLYLATAPKSNSALAFFDALSVVEKEQDAEAPDHLKDASRDAEGLGHGQGYLYPHAYRGHWVAQQYLPVSLQGRLFYQPGNLGYESQIRQEVARRREAQLAAMLEESAAALAPGAGRTPPPSGPPAANLWLQRTLSNLGEQLAQMRQRVMALAGIERHSLVLDIAAGNGLLTWEAVRLAPVGGVWALAVSAREAQALQQMAGHLDEMERPHILTGALSELPALLAMLDEPVRFDVILGRNALTAQADKAARLRELWQLLAPGGRLALAQTIPAATQRIYALVQRDSLPADLAQEWQAAEEAIYSAVGDPLVNWDAGALGDMAQAAGFEQVSVETVAGTSELRVTPALLARWFAEAEDGGRPSYMQRLAQRLDGEALAFVRALIEQQLLGQSAPWASTVAYLRGVHPTSG